uniref:Uncharacterized protein n=1 Tax=Ditylenchus dipsaci TaxID=166011 RepID=A0A915ELZ5_9BILA
MLLQLPRSPMILLLLQSNRPELQRVSMSEELGRGAISSCRSSPVKMEEKEVMPSEPTVGKGAGKRSRSNLLVVVRRLGLLLVLLPGRLLSSARSEIVRCLKIVVCCVRNPLSEF